MSATSSISANETLLVGVYHNPPKLFVDDQGKLRGVLGELLEAIARQEKWSLESIACEFQHCLELLERGDIDLMPDVAWSEERAERVAFHHEPIMHTWSQLYQHEGEGVEAILDLDQKRVAVVNGSIQQDYLRAVTERFDVMVDWQLVDSHAEGFQAVAMGEADLAVSDHLVGDWRAHNYGLFETPIIFQPIRLFYAGSPTLSATVLERIDDVLRRWKQAPRSEYFAARLASRCAARRHHPRLAVVVSWAAGRHMRSGTGLCPVASSAHGVQPCAAQGQRSDAGNDSGQR